MDRPAWPRMAQLVCMAAFLISAKESVHCQTLKGLYMVDGRNWKSITTHEESPTVFLPEIAVPDELSVCVVTIMNSKIDRVGFRFGPITDQYVRPVLEYNLVSTLTAQNSGSWTQATRRTSQRALAGLGKM